jgi:hypothetical protein
MNLEQFRQVAREIFDLQRERMFIVYGLYAPDELLDALRPELTADDPPTGAVGRFAGVPVRPESAFGQASESDAVRFDRHEGMGFSYVQMDVAD